MRRLSLYILCTSAMLMSAQAQTKSGGISPEMLQEIQVVYDRFLEKNSLNAQNTFSYAILQYLRGNRDESKKLLEPMYIRDYKYHFTRETLVDSDIKNFLCGALLGEIDVADFRGTVYDELGFVNGVEMCLIECLQVTNY